MANNIYIIKGRGRLGADEIYLKTPGLGPIKLGETDVLLYGNATLSQYCNRFNISRIYIMDYNRQILSVEDGYYYRDAEED